MGEPVDPHDAVAAEFDHPIVVPFRGMFRDGEDEALRNAPTYEELHRDAEALQIEKLERLAIRLGIDLSAPDGWKTLALSVAKYYHPGFKVVYDEENARIFYSLYGFTPIFPLKGRLPSRILQSTEDSVAISKILQPKVLALLVNVLKDSGRSDEDICESLVERGDKKMTLRKNRPEKVRRVATMVRKLSEGRKELKKQRDTTGEKNGV